MTYFMLNKDRAEHEQFVKNLYLVTVTATCHHTDSDTCPNVALLHPGSVPLGNYSSEAGSFGVI